MNTFLALLLVFLAGSINGSFATLSKHMPKWNFENIWLQYSIWAFIILPWLTIFILVPNIFQILHATPMYYLTIIIAGGTLFGLGQIGFALAINMIGIGLAFTICLGLSMSLGSLLPLILQHTNKIFTMNGLLTLLGTSLALLGLIAVSYAGHLRDQSKKSFFSRESHSKHFYLLGIFFATLAGLFSALQNLSFSLTAPMHTIALHLNARPLGADNIIWPLFLTFSFIPYALYMLFLHKKNRSFHHYRTKQTAHYFLFSLVMGLFWFSSIILYSKSSKLIGSLGPVIIWPLFMTLIILTSFFVSLWYKEWETNNKRIKKIVWSGIGLLILAILFFSYTT